jgi:hypothetical protein
VDAVMGTEPRGDLADLVWLTGSWMLVLGLNRTVIKGRTVAFEYVRIESTPQGIVYLAGPKGRHPPTRFALAESGPRWVAFENPTHDFPQRIVYERKGDRLDARIEGEQDGKPISEEWSWRRTTLEAMP